MANDEFPGAPAPTPDLHALQARMERLELEMAALRRRLDGGRDEVAASATASAASLAEAHAAPPPPPLPLAAEMASETAAFPLNEQWTQPPAPDLPAPKSRESLESRLGSQYFNRIAIVLLLTGTAYGMKMAVDRGFVGPGLRVVLGLLAGGALVLWSERFRKKGFAAFSYSLKALGSGVLYLALWAGFRLYHLVPAPVALLLMVLVTLWNAYMAWAQNAELLAGYAIAGGFATPLLLASGGDHEVFLFTYLLAIDVATVLLVRLRRWPRLLLGAFPLTVGYFCGWYSEYFASADEFGITCFFIALFAAAFASVPLWPATAPPESEAIDEVTLAPSPKRVRRMGVLENIFLPLANSAFAALAYYAVLQEADHRSWLPWMMLLLAAVYLVIMRLPQSKVAAAMHLSIAIVLLTIAIPLKASGHWITVSWLVEGLALTWVASRLTQTEGQADPETAYAGSTLRWLAMGSLLLGFCGVCFHVLDTVGSYSLPFFNSGLGTALTGIVAFAAVAWLASRVRAERGEAGAEPWVSAGRVATMLVPITALLLSLRELGSGIGYRSSLHAPFQSAEFLTALLALALFAGVIAVAIRQSTSELSEDSFWINCAALVTIAFNIVAVLTGVREVSALFAPAANAWTADAGLQQSLAISGFLMLYGAALLAVGFWKRNGFLRWQALALLVFTIVKAFVYDMRNLSQGYRVVSLMALGALLLAVSFAYQKDWLNLKGARPLSGERDAS